MISYVKELRKIYTIFLKLKKKLYKIFKNLKKNFLSCSADLDCNGCLRECLHRWWRCLCRPHCQHSFYTDVSTLFLNISFSLCLCVVRLKCILPFIATADSEHILSNNEDEDFICDQTTELKIYLKVLLMIIIKNYSNKKIAQEND